MDHITLQTESHRCCSRTIYYFDAIVAGIEGELQESIRTQDKFEFWRKSTTIRGFYESLPRRKDYIERRIGVVNAEALCLKAGMLKDGYAYEELSSAIHRPETLRGQITLRLINDLKSGLL